MTGGPYVLSRGPLECFVCHGETAAETAAHVEVMLISSSPATGKFSVAVPVCPACEQRAIEQDGGPEQLHADIRAMYAAEAAQAPATAPAASLTLPRRKCKETKFPRRHPAGHERLLENPPAPDAHLVLIVGASNVGLLRDFERLLVIEQTHKPEFADLRAVAGRRVIVGHRESAEPRWLIRLAQALIDHGATEVELRTIGPDAKHDSRLRIVPEVSA